MCAMVRVCVYVSMLWNGDSFRRVLYYILNSILCYNVHTHTHTHTHTCKTGPQTCARLRSQVPGHLNRILNTHIHTCKLTHTH